MNELFARFGLNQKETTAFLELVQLGAKPISIWAGHAGINRSSMYVVFERLEKAGLVTTFLYKGVKYAQALPVIELPALLKTKEELIANTRALLQSSLPELQKLEKTHGITPEIRFYEGVHRVGAMYEEVLKEASFKAFFHPGRVKNIMPEFFHKIPLTLRERGGRAQELLVRCPEATEYIKAYRTERHQIALLPKEVTFSSDTIITKQKIYLVGYGPEVIVGTEIWNEELAQTQAVLFDLVWASAWR
ncbi:MAG: helix-turn-helix domain-containing protein [Patescibacteria group bacterium]